MWHLVLCIEAGKVVEFIRVLRCYRCRIQGRMLAPREDLQVHTPMYCTLRDLVFTFLAYTCSITLVTLAPEMAEE